MQRSESFLPPERRFNAVVDDVGDILDEVITEAQKEWGDILDPKKELDNNFTLVYELTQRLAHEMSDHERDDIAEVTRVMYRAAMFALVVIDDIKVEPVRSLPIGQYIDRDGWSQDQMRQDISDYLSESPLIDALIGKYMPEIDTSTRYNRHAEIAAGLVFMLAERQIADGHMMQSAQDIVPEQIIAGTSKVNLQEARSLHDNTPRVHRLPIGVEVLVRQLRDGVQRFNDAFLESSDADDRPIFDMTHHYERLKKTVCGVFELLPAQMRDSGLSDEQSTEILRRIIEAYMRDRKQGPSRVVTEPDIADLLEGVYHTQLYSREECREEVDIAVPRGMAIARFVTASLDNEVHALFDTRYRQIVKDVQQD